nr:Zn-ribbon domain-containing OB-fold protein [Candidatus Njordarchaeota archaeon]
MSIASPMLWREIPQLYRLIGLKCKKCGYINFPRMGSICLKCGSSEGFEDHQISRRGKVVTFTVEHVMPPGFEIPTIMAIVDTDDGARLMVSMTQAKPEEVKIDMPVELVFRRFGEADGLLRYGFRAKPIKESGDVKK